MPLSRQAIWLALALLGPLLALGFEARGDAWEWGLGSHSLARGGTCVAWADEATAGSCNPAGPAMLPGIRVLVGLMPQVGSAAVDERLLGGSAGWGALALSGSVALGSQGGEVREFWGGSLALRTGERFGLGVGVSSHHQGSGEAEAEQLGLDLGVLWRMGPTLLWGVDFRNEFRGGPTVTAPLTRFGAKLDLGWLSGSGELALSPSAPLRLRWGAEMAFFKPLIIRLGNADGHWTGGLGFDSGRLNADFALLGTEAGPVWMLSTEMVFYSEEVAE